MRDADRVEGGGPNQRQLPGAAVAWQYLTWENWEAQTSSPAPRHGTVDVTNGEEATQSG